MKRFSQHWWATRFYAGLADQQLRRIGGRRLLEVGCGVGYLLAMLEDRYETCGLDISPHAIEQCRRFAPRSRCAVADFEQGLPPELALGTFDVVVAKYVLEHLRSPQAALAGMRTLLRPGGVLIFAVPNTASLGARWKGSAWYADPTKDPTHCSLLAPERWRELTRAAGLTIRRETADGFWDVPYVSWLPRLVQSAVFLPPTILACLLARPVLPARWGENIIIFAERPGTD